MLDEPTSALGEAEVKGLYGLVRQLASQGTAVVYVTHRLREYFDLCERVTVLRDGQVTADVRVGQLDEARLIELMVGRGVDLAPKPAPTAVADSRPRLQVRGLSVGTKLTDVSVTVASGDPKLMQRLEKYLGSQVPYYTFGGRLTYVLMAPGGGY